MEALGSYFGDKIFMTKAIVGAIILYKFTMYLLDVVERRKYAQIGRSKLNERNAKTYNFKPIPADKTNLILSSCVAELIELMKKGEVTSEEIVIVYSNRAATIAREHNLSQMENFEEAIELAKRADTLMEEARKTKDFSKIGLLHGIPISIKDHVMVKGLNSPNGLIARCNIIDREDAVVIQLLRDQGAIPFLKGNMPQIGMTIDTRNKIYGQSLNPWNKERTCGGSSGGDAGIVSSRCAPIALGTDIGGSLRMPAHFCGISTFKPTPQRVPIEGLIFPSQDGLGGQQTIKLCCGPLGRKVEDLTLFLKSVWQKKLFEMKPFLPAVPFNEELYKSDKPLRIGYFDSVDAFESCSSVKRSIQHSVSLLKTMGHEVIKIEPPSIDKVSRIFTRIIMPTLHEPMDYAKKEGLLECYSEMALLYKGSWLKRWLVLGLLRLLGQKRALDAAKGIKREPAYKVLKGLKQRQALIEEYLNLWKEKNLDVVVCPVFPLPAFYFKQVDRLLSGIIYCALWNVLNFPSGVIPFGFVNPEEMTYEDKHNDFITKVAKRAMQNSAGLPIGVQVVALPFRDELALNVMKQLESKLKFKDFSK